MMRIVVVGIHTEVGKTLVSAILTKMLHAEYWKVLQAGFLDQTDSATVSRLSGAYCHPEAYQFSSPLSPHQAARIDQIPIDVEKFCLPETSSPLIIETAGGMLSPCGETLLQGDVFASWSCSWLLVSRAYLGSINHTLLTLEALRSRKIHVLGMILNNYSEEEELWLQKMTGLPLLGSLRQEQEVTPELVLSYANNWKELWSRTSHLKQLLSGIPSLSQA
ncbi:dethiobiotin synthase [Chlamydia pecorum]|uniref:dethiobiotin synthase n=1 Tax=Chlamydia pecorum TaxID=85991 RepID=UPI0006876C65|nr:dethiobiotin synthase [Chlamydia pecorum]